MSDMLNQNVEINSDIDSIGKVESKSRKLKFHDITYENVSGAFKKRLAERNIKKEIKEEVNDFVVDNDQEHLDKVSVLMSQYKFINTGVKESPEFVARRAIRLNEQMIFNAKLNSKLIEAMLEKEKVDNVSAIDESEEEKLVNAINQLNESDGVVTSEESSVDESASSEFEENVVRSDFTPVTDGFSSATIDNDQEEVKENTDASDEKVEGKMFEMSESDFAPLFNNTDMNEKKEAEEAHVDKGILAMTENEIEASRKLLEKTEPRPDRHKFSFEDIFNAEEESQKINDDDSVEVKEFESAEDAFLEVDKLLQQADDLRSRGNKAYEEREKAEQRRKAAEDRRRQANDDEAMKKAALAEAIEKYKAYVAELKANENETLKDIEDANAAADKEEEETRAAEERSAYTQKVIDSLISSMENKPKRR